MIERPFIWIALSAVDYSLEHHDIAGWDTRILDSGGEGPVMILMHGTGGHLEAYAHNIAVLAQEYRIIAYDYPGHGYTTHATADLELDTYLEHLEALIDWTGSSSVVLNGESLGGWIGVKYASRHPSKVDRLILNTPGGTMATPEVMERIRTLSQEAADDPTPERIRARLEWLMADPETVSDELVEVRRHIYSRPGFSDSMKHILCLQDPKIRHRNLVTDDELRSIVCPTLVIWTSDDPSGPAAAGMDMADKIEHGRFALVADAGHWPQWEQTDRFHDQVLGFLNEQQ